MVWGSPGPMLESLLPLCWSNCCVVPFAMADALPRFFVDPGGCRRERVAPKRSAPRDLRPVVHSAYEDENKQGLGYNEHDPRHGLRLGRVLVGGVVNTSRSERGDGEQRVTRTSPRRTSSPRARGSRRIQQKQIRTSIYMYYLFIPRSPRGDSLSAGALGAAPGKSK